MVQIDSRTPMMMLCDMGTPSFAIASVTCTGLANLPHASKSRKRTIRIVSTRPVHTAPPARCSVEDERGRPLPAAVVIYDLLKMAACVVPLGKISSLCRNQNLRHQVFGRRHARIAHVV